MIKYALDLDSLILWCADDPSTPTRVKCPLCGAREYRKISPLRNAYYALYPGECHRYDECRALDGSSNMPDISKTNFGRLFARLFSGSKTLPNGAGENNSDTTPDTLDDVGVTNGSGDFNNPKDQVDADEEDYYSIGITTGPITEKLQGIRSLKQMAVLGLLNCEDRTLNEHVRLSDLTINPQYAYMLLDMQETFGRVLQCKPQIAMDAKQTIRLKVFIYQDSSGRAIRTLLITDVHIPDKTLYQEIRKLLFVQFTDVDGKMKVTRRYDKVAIAGTWVFTRNGRCNCRWNCPVDWTCAGYLYMELDKKDRVFPLPDTEIRQNKPANQE